MIKRLRIRFICMTMAIATLLLLAIFCVICYGIWTGLKAEISESMHSASLEPWRPGDVDDDQNQSNWPCFLLSIDKDGRLCVSGHAYYDLSDEAMLRQILQEAQDTGLEEGVLRGRNLRFLRIQLWKLEEYVFTDISGTIKTMENLVWVCSFVCLLALVVFFITSWRLSRWMVRPIEKALQQQRQFVADASHELKTPLTVILTNAELLQSDEHQAEAKHRFSQSILTAACQMRSLVEGLLELARVDNSPAQQQMTCVDLSEVTDNAVMSFEPLYFEAGRELVSTIAPGVTVGGNRQQLRQVIDILLDNGCKYSLPGSQVVLTLEHSHKHCLLQVRSCGQPLTAQQCKDIFKRFYRVDEARSGSQSYGLGLSIAESLVRRHRGKIWCQSKDDINTFCVSLPTREPKK